MHASSCCRCTLQVHQEQNRRGGSREAHGEVHVDRGRRAGREAGEDLLRAEIGGHRRWVRGEGDERVSHQGRLRAQRGGAQGSQRTGFGNVQGL